MKLRLVVPALVVSCIVAATAAHAQFFGQMGPLGPTASHGLEMLGVYGGTETGETGVFGQARIAAGAKADFGIQASFAKVSNSGPSVFGGQADYKVVVVKPSKTDQNLKIGGDVAANVSHATGETTIGIQAVPGISWNTKPATNGSKFSVWGGFGFAWMHTSISGGLSGSSSGGVLVLGGGYDLSKKLGLVAEFGDSFHSGGSASAFKAGVNFGMAK